MTRGGEHVEQPDPSVPMGGSVSWSCRWGEQGSGLLQRKQGVYEDGMCVIVCVRVCLGVQVREGMSEVGTHSGRRMHRDSLWPASAAQEGV